MTIFSSLSNHHSHVRDGLRPPRRVPGVRVCLRPRLGRSPLRGTPVRPTLLPTRPVHERYLRLSEGLERKPLLRQGVHQRLWRLWHFVQWPRNVHNQRRGSTAAYTSDNRPPHQEGTKGIQQTKLHVSSIRPLKQCVTKYAQKQSLFSHSFLVNFNLLEKNILPKQLWSRLVKSLDWVVKRVTSNIKCTSLPIFPHSLCKSFPMHFSLPFPYSSSTSLQ